MKCELPGCKRRTRMRYLMSFKVDGKKRFGYVCGTHDRVLGRQNLMATGMTLDKTIKFEKKH